MIKRKGYKLYLVPGYEIEVKEKREQNTPEHRVVEVKNPDLNKVKLLGGYLLAALFTFLLIYIGIYVQKETCYI